MPTQQGGRPWKPKTIRLWQASESADPLATLDFWSPDAINHGGQTTQASRKPPPGREGLQLVLASLHTAFPDREYRIEDIIAEGDKVVCRLLVSGTHQGVPAIPIEGGMLNTHPPTGKPYQVQHIHIFRMANGRIAEHWATRDDLGLMQQLGIVAAA
ncbi:MAG: ester cyclase [Ktedonobacterales bacterium]|nr:ester cyclase [Ktedonobacterales bacterium]